MKFIFFFFLTIFLNQTLSAKDNNNYFSCCDTIIKNIPKTSTGKRYSLSYRLSKQITNQLGLDSLELGYDSVQIRIWWTGIKVIQNDTILILSSKGNNPWSSTLYTFENEFISEKIYSSVRKYCVKKINEPLFGWDSFLQKLSNWKLDSLHVFNFSEYMGKYKTGEEKEYYIEVATKKKYSFYSYNWVDEIAKENANMQSIKELINLFATNFFAKE